MAAWIVTNSHNSRTYQTVETSCLAAQAFLFLVMLLLGGFLLSVGAPMQPCAELHTLVQTDLLERDAYAAVPHSASPLFFIG